MSWFRSRKPRKVLCSIGAGPHEELLKLSGATFEIFAERHGYDLDLRTTLADKARPAAWSKLVLIRGLLSTHDTVLWVDADAAIVDVTRDIADDMNGQYLGLVAHHYDNQVIPNSGVMLLNRSRLTNKFLERAWNATRWIDHPWWENAAILELMGHEVGDGPGPVTMKSPTKFYREAALLGKEWNSITIDEAAHPRIRHYPGQSQEYRLEHLQADLDQLRAAIGAGS